MTQVVRIIFILVVSLWVYPLTGWAITDPLNAQVRFSLPDSVETVGQALTYFLAPSQYRLTTLPPASPKAREGLRAALPFPLPIQRVLTVKEALLAVTPEAWSLVIDRENKLIALMPYQPPPGQE
jgi:hypothetical protein